MANVVVLAENVEHGLALAGQLRGWPLFTGEGVHGRGLSAQELPPCRVVSRTGAGGIRAAFGTRRIVDALTL